MNTEDTPAVQSDRRQYVRVHDAVGLEIQKLNEMPAAGQVVTPKPRKTVGMDPTHLNHKLVETKQATRQPSTSLSTDCLLYTSPSPRD